MKKDTGMDYLSTIVRFIFIFKLGENVVQVGGEEQLVTNNQNPHRYKGILFYQAKSTYKGLLHGHATSAPLPKYRHQRAGEGSVIPLTL